MSRYDKHKQAKQSRIITTTELALIAGCNPERIRQMIRNGRGPVPVYRSRSHYKFRFLEGFLWARDYCWYGKE